MVHRWPCSVLVVRAAAVGDRAVALRLQREREVPKDFFKGGFLLNGREAVGAVVSHPKASNRTLTITLTPILLPLPEGGSVTLLSQPFRTLRPGQNAASLVANAAVSARIAAAARAAARPRFVPCRLQATASSASGAPTAYYQPTFFLGHEAATYAHASGATFVRGDAEARGAPPLNVGLVPAAAAAVVVEAFARGTGAALPSGAAVVVIGTLRLGNERHAVGKKNADGPAKRAYPVAGIYAARPYVTAPSRRHKAARLRLDFPRAATGVLLTSFGFRNARANAARILAAWRAVAPATTEHSRFWPRSCILQVQFPLRRSPALDARHAALAAACGTSPTVRFMKNHYLGFVLHLSLPRGQGVTDSVMLLIVPHDYVEARAAEVALARGAVAPRKRVRTAEM